MTTIKGSESRSFFSSGTGLLELSGSSLVGHTLEFSTPNVADDVYTGNDYNTVIPISYDWTYSVDTLYWGDGAKAIKESAEAIGTANVSKWAMYARDETFVGEVLPTGYEWAAGDEELQTLNPTLMGNGPCYGGVRQTFNIASGSGADQSLSSKPSGFAGEFFIIVENAGTETVTMKLEQGSNESAAIVVAKGIYFMSSAHDYTTLSFSGNLTADAVITVVYGEAIHGD